MADRGRSPGSPGLKRRTGKAMQRGDNFCSTCATPLETREVNGARRPVCPACRRVVYYDPKVAAVTIISREGKVLLMRRAGDPGKGLWSVPGGYVDRGEVVEAAATREVQEETGLLVKIDRLVGLFSEQGRPVIVAVYSGVECGGQLAPGPEALEVGFFAPENLPPLAFAGDVDILRQWARDVQASS